MSARLSLGALVGRLYTCQSDGYTLSQSCSMRCARPFSRTCFAPSLPEKLRRRCVLVTGHRRSYACHATPPHHAAPRHAAPRQIIYQNELCIAFKDIEPAAETHLLIIPRKHIDDWTKVIRSLHPTATPRHATPRLAMRPHPITIDPTTRTPSHW